MLPEFIKSSIILEKRKLKILPDWRFGQSLDSRHSGDPHCCLILGPKRLQSPVAVYTIILHY